MTYPLILASGSPRRLALLQTCGIPISAVAPSDIPEMRTADEPILSYVQRLSKEKSLAQRHQGAWVLAADTIVCLNEQVFEKPNDDDHATQMLKQLSGQWHTVITAWAISEHSNDLNEEAKIYHSGHCISDVQFRELTPTEIKSYIQTEEGRDKAGSYGIQGLGAALVRSIKGDYSNIVGLPMTDVLRALDTIGIHPMELL